MRNGLLLLDAMGDFCLACKGTLTSHWWKTVEEMFLDGWLMNTRQIPAAIIEKKNA